MYIHVKRFLKFYLTNCGTGIERITICNNDYFLGPNWVRGRSTNRLGHCCQPTWIPACLRAHTSCNWGGWARLHSHVPCCEEMTTRPMTHISTHLLPSEAWIGRYPARARTKFKTKGSPPDPKARQAADASNRASNCSLLPSTPHMDWYNRLRMLIRFPRAGSIFLARGHQTTSFLLT